MSAIAFFFFFFYLPVSFDVPVEWVSGERV